MLSNTRQLQFSYCDTDEIKENDREADILERQDLPTGALKKLKQFIHREDAFLNTISREDIRLVYTFTSNFGSGQFGSVRIAHKTAVSPDISFAVKSIRREIIEDSWQNEEELI